MTIRMCKRAGTVLHASRSQARDREMSTGSLIPLERQLVALSFSVAGTLMRVYARHAQVPW